MLHVDFRCHQIRPSGSRNCLLYSLEIGFFSEFDDPDFGMGMRPSRIRLNWLIKGSYTVLVFGTALSLNR